jgi:hypothetical protein
VANDSSKQKRARANKAQREALAARTQAAATPRPSRVAPAAGGATAAATTRRASKVSRPPQPEGEQKTAGRASARPARPLRPGDTPVDVDSLEGSFYVKVMQVPGGRQVLTAAFTAVLGFIGSVLTLFFLHQQEYGLSKKAAKTAPFETAIHRDGPLVLIPAVLGLVAAAVALRFALHPNRRWIWLGTAIFSVFLVVFMQQTLFIFSAGMLGYAVMRSSKVEGPNESIFGRGRRAAATDAETVETTGSEADGD